MTSDIIRTQSTKKKWNSRCGVGRVYDTNHSHSVVTNCLLISMENTFFLIILSQLCMRF